MFAIQLAEAQLLQSLSQPLKAGKTVTQDNNNSVQNGIALFSLVALLRLQVNTLRKVAKCMSKALFVLISTPIRMVSSVIALTLMRTNCRCLVLAIIHRIT